MSLASDHHLKQSSHMHNLVGYPVDNYSHSADVLLSVEENDGFPTIVELWRDIRPEETIDVGRTLEGELVWVTKTQTSSTPANKVSIIPPRSNAVDRDTALQDDAAATSPFWGKLLNTNRENLKHRLHEVISKVKNRKYLFLFSAVTALVVILISGGLFPTADEQSEPTPQPPINESQSTDSLGAEEWVKNQILEGQIPEIVLRNDTTLEAIVTTTVSSAGGAVLVDVTYPALSGNESMTVLVQKTSDSWRLRHVYDQKS
jgi:hypothetical protein